MLPSNIELLKHILDEITFILSSTMLKNKEEVVKRPYIVACSYQKSRNNWRSCNENRARI